jgi:ATP phosphoribosyltransferase regulatory subunit
VFEAVVAGLGLPAGWQKRLIHAFGNEQALDAMIARLASPDQSAARMTRSQDSSSRGDVTGLENHIESGDAGHRLFHPCQPFARPKSPRG